ncbi:hypothetical protein HDU85_004526 [Gaertneriomyces sp. JEL0708]|nr:hypothetical protein HDU85_004526 [Gaertneriomyces sp. JEL0708]
MNPSVPRQGMFADDAGVSHYEDDLELDDDINELLPSDDLYGDLSPRRRSSSGSFDFAPQAHLFPLSRTLSKFDTDLPKNLTFWSGLAIIIGMSIGSGIFASGGPVFRYAGSAGAALLVWLIAGLLALTGAVCYADLGTSIPSSGGEHAYLERAFGSLPAFLFGWTGATITRPASIAIITVVCAEYIARMLLHGGSASSEPPAWLIKALACLCIAVLTGVNCYSAKLGALVQDIFAVLKVILLVAIATIGLVEIGKAGVRDNAHPLDWNNLFEGSSRSLSAYSLALYQALWAYDGWNNLNIVTGELKNPSRDLPKAIITGPCVVTICYLLANVAFYTALPADVLLKTNSIAMDFGKHVMGGNFGGLAISLVVALSTASAASAAIFTGSRVSYVAGKSLYLPAFLATIHSKYRTPFNALIVQSLIATVLVLIGSFTSLVNFYSMVAWLFYLMAILALVVLRWTEPHLERPFKVWIAMPIVFACSTAFLLVLSAMEAPSQALAAVLFILSGCPVWWVVVKKGFSWEYMGSKCVELIPGYHYLSPTGDRGKYQPQSSHDDGLELVEAHR